MSGWEAVIQAAALLFVVALAVWIGHTSGVDEGFARGWERGYQQRAIDNRFIGLITLLSADLDSDDEPPARPYDWAEGDEYEPGTEGYAAWFE